MIELSAQLVSIWLSCWGSIYFFFNFFICKTHTYLHHLQYFLYLDDLITLQYLLYLEYGTILNLLTIKHITSFIVSIIKFSIVIGSPRAYLSRHRRAITWVSNYSCPIWKEFIFCCFCYVPIKLIIIYVAKIKSPKSVSFHSAVNCSFTDWKHIQDPPRLWSPLPNDLPVMISGNPTLHGVLLVSAYCMCNIIVIANSSCSPCSLSLIDLFHE